MILKQTKPEKEGDKMEAGMKKESMKIVPPGKKRCVWMEAGVVSYKLCDNNFDCPTCAYDQAMQTKIARQKAEAPVDIPDAAADTFVGTWVEKMMQLPASQRKCRYMITGEVGRKLCPNAYECGSCSFDQMMQRRLQAEPRPIRKQSHAGGFAIPEGIYLHEGHMWARPEYGGRVRVGLDDFAQRLLGEVDSIGLPDVGKEIRQGKAVIQVKWNGDTARILSPVDGVVTFVNRQVTKDQGILNRSPYEEGWLFVIEPIKLKKNLKGLFYDEEIVDFMDKESETLLSMANEGMRLSADGGVSVDDVFKELEGENRARFVKTFFRT